MRYLLFLLILTVQTYAGVPLRVSDEELAAKSDHVFVAHVVGVDMVDHRGRAITDEEAMTGPGLKNTIRLKIRVDEPLVTNAKNVPKHLHVPLDSFMHYSLGQVKKAHAGENRKFLFLLAGKKFSPPVAGVFKRDLKKRDFFVERVKKRNAKIK